MTTRGCHAVIEPADVYLLSGSSGSREMALAATIFTLLLSLYGFSITLSGGRIGDVAYHIALLVMLAVLILWLTISGRAPSVSASA